MDLAARIQQLESLVTEAKSMPLSASVLVNREELLELIKEMQESLPEEVKQARWVVKDREELLAKARREADSFLEKAHQEQLRLASQEEVLQRAAEEAEGVLAQAREEARQIRLEGEDYVDAKLAQFEIALRKIQEEAERNVQAISTTLEQVGAGREKLRGAAHPAEELAPAPEGPHDQDAEGVGEQEG